MSYARGIKMDKNNDKNIQTIYINMDDSGQLAQNNPNELLFVYGGVFFLSLTDQENFDRQYRALVNTIKSKYCIDFKKDSSLNDKHCEKHLIKIANIIVQN